MAHEGGRPTVMTDEVLQKLEYAFSIGCTDTEACLYADIAPSTLYAYQKDNTEFLERKSTLKERPVLLARTKVVQGIQENADLALKFLERKKKDEFSLRVENTGADGQPIKVNLVSYGDNSTPQLPTETLPTTPPESDGLGISESGGDLASESGQG